MQLPTKYCFSIFRGSGTKWYQVDSYMSTHTEQCVEIKR